LVALERDGPDFLSTEDGERFGTLNKVRFHTRDQEITFNAIPALTVFKGKLYTAPTGASGGNINVSGVTYVYATDDPGFGKLPDVATVYDLAPMGGHLYAGTGGLEAVFRFGAPPRRVRASHISGKK
jgi:hypothetical protein